MPVKTETQTGIKSHLKIISVWAWALGAIAFIAAQWFFNFQMVHLQHARCPPAWGRFLLGLLAGVGAVCLFALYGYVNRDAKRRGMSPTLWTIIAIFVPNGIGLLLYFVLRKPLPSSCPQCGCAVQPGFNFCPQCNYKLSPSCSQCQRIISVGDLYCPYCGTTQQTKQA